MLHTPAVPGTYHNVLADCTERSPTHLYWQEILGCNWDILEGDDYIASPAAVLLQNMCFVEESRNVILKVACREPDILLQYIFVGMLVEQSPGRATATCTAAPQNKTFQSWAEPGAAKDRTRDLNSCTNTILEVQLACDQLHDQYCI